MKEIENNDLLKYPNYLLSTYQLEIYRVLATYMAENNLKKKEVAAKMDVSNSYVSQILKGKFNFTLKKLIELGMAINKVPYLEFIDQEEYWRREREGTIKEYVYTVTVNENTTQIADNYENSLLNIGVGGKLPNRVTITEKASNPVLDAT